MKQRVRPKWSDEQLAEIYATPHDHRIYGMGHHLRVQLTIAIGAAWATQQRWRSVADLSCGNGAILDGITEDWAPLGPTPTIVYGDYAPRYDVHGPLEETLHDLPDVDGYVLSETLEHLDDPEAVLELIREKAKHLVLTTPLEAWNDSNGEHYWAWDRGGVEAMLKRCGWTPDCFATLDSRVFKEPYLYGIWVAS